MFKLSIDYPDGSKIVLSSNFRQQILARWKEVNRLTKEPMTDNDRNSYLMEAFDAMTKFDCHKGITKGA